MNVEEEYLRKIVQLFNDPANPALQHEVEALRAQSASHEKFFLEVQKLWISSAELKDLEAIDVAEATARLSVRLKQTQGYINRHLIRGVYPHWKNM